MEEDYVLPERHLIAARITAENPDEGFKPTSGGALACLLSAILSASLSDIQLIQLPISITSS